MPVLLPVIAFMAVWADTARGAAPRRKVVGVVTDSVSGERLSFVNVYSKKANSGTTTDLNGVFTLHVPAGTVLEATSLGYAPMSMGVGRLGDTIRFRLRPSATDLEEVVVKPKKQKYSKKNNPAVELMRRVRKDREKIQPSQAPYYSYDQYDKMVLALNDYKGYLPGADGKVKGRFKSLAELVDTGIWTGKRILDVSLKEKLSSRIMTGDGVDRQIVKAQRSNGIDKSIDEGYSRVVLEDALREVNVYDNDISLMRSRFVSPLSPISADYYMFHIEDTVLIGNDRCVELSFAPHNPESMGFNGKLYVPVNDSVKWVRRVMMRLPKAAKVNYVEGMVLSQTFTRDSLGFVNKTLDDMVVELHLVGSVGRGYMSRQTRYDNHSHERREDLEEFYDKIGSIFVLEDAADQDMEFWQQARMLPLSYAESKLATEVSPFRKIPVIYWGTKFVELCVKGYLKTSRNSLFDIGPIDTFIANGGLEGWRVALGGMTTANLNSHLFGRGYVAYGFGDHRWKYMAELSYSFKPKKYHSYEFPVNGFRVSYMNDVSNIGQNYVTNSGRNLLNSFKRTGGNLSTYQQLGKLEYEIEWQNHLSLAATLQYKRQEASVYVPFIDGRGNVVNSYVENGLKLRLRYATEEKFLQTNTQRKKVNNDSWIFTLSHTIGPKGTAGSAYTLNLTELCVEKRFWFSAFGYTDLILKGGKLWSQVQFPALLWQNANIAFTIQKEAFSLLNPMELAMDQYVYLDLTYNMNGLIFNRIPFIRRLGLREIVSFKGFAGSLTKKNNPDYNDNLFRFPAPDRTRAMGKTPYMEVSVGIANILTFLRLDYVWRLTYKNTPGAPDSGLRFALAFSF